MLQGSHEQQIDAPHTKDQNQRERLCDVHQNVDTSQMAPPPIGPTHSPQANQVSQHLTLQQIGYRSNLCEVSGVSFTLPCHQEKEGGGLDLGVFTAIQKMGEACFQVKHGVVCGFISPGQFPAPVDEPQLNQLRSLHPSSPPPPQQTRRRPYSPQR